MIAQWMIDVQGLLNENGTAAEIESKDGAEAVVTYRATAGVCTYTDLARVIPANVDCIGYDEQDNIDFDGDRIVTAHLRIDKNYFLNDEKLRPRYAEQRTSEVGNAVKLTHPNFGQ